MSKVHAVMVTYNPDLDIVARNIENLLMDPAIGMVHIVDNTSGGSVLDKVEKSKVATYCLGDNRGIATAQNVGIQAALEMCADYIILFDQDSFIEMDLVSKLLNGIQQAKAQGSNIACLGPRPLDVFSGKKYRSVIQKEKVLSSNITLCSQIIASGKLIDSAALKVVGLMEDSLFIDGVDHEWCWRAKKHGYVVAICESAIMKHTLGDAREKFMGLTYKVGSAIRMYYQFRNTLILSRRGYVPLYWKFRNILGMFLKFCVFGIGRADAAIRRRYMIHGIVDGFKKRVGPYRNR